LEKFQKIESLLKMAACSDTDLQEFLNDIIWTKYGMIKSFKQL
jgi:hypothetical protein